jgi:hypothetical protein
MKSSIQRKGIFNFRLPIITYKKSMIRGCYIKVKPLLLHNTLDFMIKKKTAFTVKGVQYILARFYFCSYLFYFSTNLHEIW